MKNNLGLFLSKRALLSPDREAYVESDGSLRLTFKELNLRCNQLANGFVEAGVEKGAPRVYGWQGAFGIMVTVVWLYVEILRLLAILRGE